MKAKLFSALFVAAALTACLSVSAFAGNYDIKDGSITVAATAGGQTVTFNGINYDDTNPVITGSTESNTITITATENKTATVTLSGVNIDVSGINNKAALFTSGAGNVTVKLSGSNTLKSGANCAGLQKGNTGTLTISGTTIAKDKLTATGGTGAAGIGGDGSCGSGGTATGIVISKCNVEAQGGTFGAGIGGGYGGGGSNITIIDSKVTATGEANGAGIGSGGTQGGNVVGSTINIINSEVTATGGNKAAGIGGGKAGNGSDVTIIEGSTVTAEGGTGGSGIGGGEADTSNADNIKGGSGSGITIESSTVTATGGSGGSGIGGGIAGNGSDITIEYSTVTAEGGTGSSNIGGGSGIGGGKEGSGSGVTIKSSNVTAKGSTGGSGIGGGEKGSGNNVAISGSSQVRAQGGAEDGGTKAGAAIGNGATSVEAGKEVAPNTTELTTAGRIESYSPTADITKDKPDDITPGTALIPSSSSGVNYRLIHTYVEGEGTVDPSGTVMVRDGSDRTFTLTPAAGYEVGDVVVNHKSLGAVTSFTVKDIDTDTSVEVTFVKTGSAAVATESKSNPSTGAAI